MLRDVDPFSDAFLNARNCRPDTLVTVVHLALAIAREGREGRKIGALFTVGDHQAVLARSRPLILDPLRGHPDDRKRLEAADVRETIKELAQLDGAFVVSDDGVAVAACRYLSASADGIELPLGLGTRHMAAASITRGTNAVAVVVSESSMVRVFDDGELVAEMVPEVWILRQAERRARDLEAGRVGRDATPGGA